MALEIERKYRIDSLGGLVLPPGLPIDQGYLAHDPAAVRVRTIGERGFLTIKCAPLDDPAHPGAIVREEFEYEIPADDVRSLLERCPARLTKTRHRLDSGLEIDMFHGVCEGLILAEFESEDGAPAPKPEGVVWREVTEDRRYSNSSLSRYGIPLD